MRILVISDTHITAPDENSFKEIEEEIEESDCCIHAGDFTTYPVYQKLSKKIKTYAVAGNMDDDQIADKLPKKDIFELNGFTFALIHGGGTPNNIEHYVTYQFHKKYDQIDLFIFGHSHQAVDHQINNKIYFNPGSIGDTITSSEKTYGIIEIKNKKIKRSIKKVG